MNALELYQRLGKLIELGRITADESLFVRITSLDIAWEGVPHSKITDQGVFEVSR